MTCKILAFKKLIYNLIMTESFTRMKIQLKYLIGLKGIFTVLMFYSINTFKVQHFIFLIYLVLTELVLKMAYKKYEILHRHTLLL